MLSRKIWRDFKANLGANVACIIVMAIGIMTFNSFSMLTENITSARDRYYHHYNFADGFATLSAMPKNQLDSLLSIEGIERVQGRSSSDLLVHMPDWGNNIYLRLVSFDPNDKDALNGVLQTSGLPIGTSGREVYIGEKFISAHHLSVGDPIDVVVDSKVVTLQLSGSAMSPEFVYVMKDSSTFFADAAKFDVAFMPQKDFEDLTGKKGIVTDISFTLKEGYAFDDVKEVLKERLSRYGLSSLVSAEDQISNMMLSEEIRGLQMMSGSVPIVFIGIAAVILYMMLKRLMEHQRTQIGMLKAFGYSGFQIVRSYGTYGAIIGLTGSVVGGALGVAMSGYFTEMYKVFYTIPDLTNRVTGKFFLWGVLLSVLTSVLSAVIGVRKTLSLHPSQAMSPPVPKAGGKIFLEKIKPVWSLFSTIGKMSLRNIFRNPGRSFFTLSGVTLSFSLLCIIFSYNHMIDLMMFDQFERIQLYDIKINFASPVPADSALLAVTQKEGILLAEPLFEAPVTLRNRNLTYQTSLSGYEQDTDLFRIIDQGKRFIDMPQDGVVLSKYAAKALNLKKGNTVEIESVFLKDPIRLTVSDVAEQYLSMGCFVSRENLCRALGTGDVATSVVARVENTDTVEAEFNFIPHVTSVENKNTTLKLYNDLMGPMMAEIYIMALIAVFTAFAIIYNSSVISMAERQRELSSARVLGLTPYEVLRIMLFEQIAVSIVGCLLGYPLATAMMQGMGQQYSTEMYAMPTSLSSTAWLWSLVCIYLAILFSGAAIYQKIRSLDLVSVLKERD